MNYVGAALGTASFSIPNSSTAEWLAAGQIDVLPVAWQNG